MCHFIDFIDWITLNYNPELADVSETVSELFIDSNRDAKLDSRWCFKEADTDIRLSFVFDAISQFPQSLRVNHVKLVTIILNTRQYCRVQH